MNNPGWRGPGVDVNFEAVRLGRVLVGNELSCIVLDGR